MYCIVSQIAFDISTKLPAVVASFFSSFGIDINSLTFRQQVEEYKPRRYIFVIEYLTVVHK